MMLHPFLFKFSGRSGFLYPSYMQSVSYICPLFIIRFTILYNYIIILKFNHRLHFTSGDAGTSVIELCPSPSTLFCCTGFIILVVDIIQSEAESLQMSLEQFWSKAVSKMPPRLLSKKKDTPVASPQQCYANS